MAQEHQSVPAVVALANGEVIGFAYAGEYRLCPCYEWISRFSFYIDESFRGLCVGKILLRALIDKAKRLGYWKLVSRIFA